MSADPGPDATLSASLDPVRQRLRVDRPHALEDVAERSGLEADTVRQLLAAAGRLPDDGRFSDEDVDYARDLAILLARSGVDIVEQELRLRVRAVTQIVVNALATIRLDRTLGELIASGADPDRLGAGLADVAEEIVPAVQRLLGLDYVAVLRSLLESSVVEAASADMHRPVVLAVGFVDLVGFTSLSREVDPEDVGSVLSAFEDVVSSAVEAVGEVLMVKTIGDAAMLVSGNLDRLVDVLHDVVTAEPDALRDIGRRAGISRGEVLVRDGDYVGTPVNTAARLTDLARPGTVLVAADAADQLSEDRWEQRRIPPKHLKGLGTSRPVRVRPAS